MSASLVNKLALMRAACAKVRAAVNPAEQGTTLDAIALMLDELIVIERDTPGLRAVADQRFAAIEPPHSAFAASDEEAARRVVHRLRDSARPHDAGEAQYLDAVVDIDQAYWTAIDEAALLEYGKSSDAQAMPPDDGIDNAALQRYIAATMPGEQDVEVVDSHVISRGNSKKTVHVTLRGNQRLPGEIVLRIDRSANNFLGTKVIDEFPALGLLHDKGARIPQPFALESSGQVLGDPFIISAYVGGAAIGGNYVPPPRNEALITDIAQCLAQIHQIPVDSWHETGSEHDGRAHIDQEIDKVYRDWTELDETSPLIEAAFAWIRQHVHCAYGPASVVHNDFNFNNLLVEGSRVSAVVDWEFAHVGTPAADLGYFFYSALAVASVDDFLREYVRAGGIAPSPAQLDFYILWGQLRLAIMGYQSVRSLESGRFTDIRFSILLRYRRLGMLRVAAKLKELVADDIGARPGVEMAVGA